MLVWEALGLIDRFGSGTLWKKMVKERQVLNMSIHYQGLYEFFKERAEDVNAFLNGASRPFPDRSVENDRLITLLEFEENESKMMWKQYLGLIFGAIVSSCEIILQEHIAEGKYATVDKDLQSERIAAPKTNANPESDFKIHGQLMKVKPKA